MLRITNKVYYFLVIVFLITMTACADTDSIELNKGSTDIQTVYGNDELVSNNSETRATDDGFPVTHGRDELITNNKTQISEEELTAFTVDDIQDFDSYIQYISVLPNFEPYYQLVFEFGKISGGASGIPIENAISLYQELRTTFDYINIVSQRPLMYMGTYDGNMNFIHGYEWYQSYGAAEGLPNPLNLVGQDRDGNKIITTPIKTIILCENSYSRFDGSITEGRNFELLDFLLKTPDEPIPVVLGNAYLGVYKLGEVFPMMYISSVMNFKVIGFYDSDLSFSMAVGALEDVNVDYSIVMPYFIPEYEPIDDAMILQLGFHIAELTSGYIAISEPIVEINDSTHTYYTAMVEEIAARHELSGMHMSPRWPVGFIFTR